MRTLRIGSFQPASPLLLAPIAGYCDLAFRLVVRSVPGYQGHPTLGLACTDLLCPEALLNESQKSLWLAATCPEDNPVCMQLYGRHPDTLSAAALWAVEHGATTIDLNMGCPVDKVTKKNGGSKLLTEPCLAIEIIQALAKTLEPHRVPLTAKIRLGWDDQCLITDTLPPALADAGVSAITVHGRTTEQKFRGSVRLDGITRVVESVKRHHPDVAVIGNGDITSPQDAEQMFNTTGCDGVMIGRGALGQPWVFRDTACYLATGELPPPLSRPERAALVLQHFENLARMRDERVALNTIKRRMSWYSAHLQPWPGLRRDVQDVASGSQFRDFWAAGVARMADTPEPAAA
ncbi:MAG: tRNA-dihydrouridine synthase [Phycisphaeraceae bacterium]